MALNLKSLIGKLTVTARRGLESAAGLAVSRTHYDVDMEHWLTCLMEREDGDLVRILRSFDADPDRVLRDLNAALNLAKTGNSRRPDLSPDIEDLAREGWVQASINLGQSQTRSGAILLAALSDRKLCRRLHDQSDELKKVGAEALAKDFLDIVAGSPEDREVYAGMQTAQREAPGAAPRGDTPTPSLDQYTVDLTAEARAGKIDPVLGREHEIRLIIDILSRRRQNNPILTGEAGVGKTAVVEGFALKIAEGEVPESLANVVLRTLDLGLLQAGAGVKGEFENRLKQVIEEVQASPRPVILFIDEAHTMIGAGGQAGQNDAANLLKPALARGELRTVAATTWAEYKKFFEKDPALSRRFQVIKVEEPSEEAAVDIMRGVARKLEEHHGVQVTDEAVQDSVRLSHRYIPARQLPDISVSVLDTACANASISRNAKPGAIEDLERSRDRIDRELANLDREAALGEDHDERKALLHEQREALEVDLETLMARWEKEKGLVEEITKVRSGLQAILAGDGDDGEAAPEGDADALRAGLTRLKGELSELQGEEPLLTPEVNAQSIAGVIGSWTGIPVGKMLADEIDTVMRLDERMGKRVIGQDHALLSVAKRIRTSRASLDNPNRPVGVFLFAGPSGVGKTESALALADVLYGGERNLITINMSEYQEAHTVSSLKGSPPGYVGYGEGGVLTEAVRRKPYSVVLLDEVEKAHLDVMELFFQIFDKGVLEDGEGREIDFKNTVILLTSNLGTDTIMTLCGDPDTAPEPEVLAEAIRDDLLKHFPPALLGRLVTVPFYPIAPDVLKKIIRLQLDRIVKRVHANNRVEFIYGDPLVEAIAGRCTDPGSGARSIDHILTHTLLPTMAGEFLTRMGTGKDFRKIEVGTDDKGDFTYEIT